MNFGFPPNCSGQGFDLGTWAPSCHSVGWNMGQRWWKLSHHSWSQTFFVSTSHHWKVWRPLSTWPIAWTPSCNARRHWFAGHSIGFVTRTWIARCPSWDHRLPRLRLCLSGSFVCVPLWFHRQWSVGLACPSAFGHATTVGSWCWTVFCHETPHSASWHQEIVACQPGTCMGRWWNLVAFELNRVAKANWHGHSGPIDRPYLADLRYTSGCAELGHHAT